MNGPDFRVPLRELVRIVNRSGRWYWVCDMTLDNESCNRPHFVDSEDEAVTAGVDHLEETHGYLRVVNDLDP